MRKAMDKHGGSGASIIDRGFGTLLKENRAFRVFGALALVTVLLGVCAAAFLVSRGFTPDSALVFLFGSLACAGLELLAWFLCFCRGEDTPFGAPGGRLLVRLVLYAAVLGLALDVLTCLSYRSAEFSAFSLTNGVKLAILMVLSFVLFLALAYQKPGFGAQAFARCRAALTGKRVLTIVAFAIASLALGCAGGALSERYAGVAFFSAAFFWTAVCAVISAFILLRRSAGAHPERLFLAVSLAFGCFFSICVPAETNVSFDDQIHFRYADGVSFITDTEYNDVELSLELPGTRFEQFGDLMASAAAGGAADDFTQADIDAYHAALNDEYANGERHIMSGFKAADTVTLLYIKNLAYAPEAVGIWLARVLHLPFVALFDLGRLFGLLFYSALVFGAIRIIPTRKVLLSLVSLLPEMIFLASSYSYDYWVNGFALLGLAFVVREMCTPRDTLRAQSWLGMWLCFFLACLPKLIYFPLFGLMFLLPKTKFTSRRHRVLFYASAVCAMVLIIIAFVAPFLFDVSANDGGGDERGGSDVNSAGQVAFILSQPLAYASILGNFLVNTYLSVAGADGYALSFAYLGKAGAGFPFLSGLTAVLLIAAALTDCNEASRSLCTKGPIIWTCIVFIGTVVLVATALYVSFTAVGSPTIEGCQPRYIIPVLMPFLALVVNPKMERRMSASAYTLAFFAVVACMNAFCAWEMVVCAILA